MSRQTTIRVLRPFPYGRQRYTPGQTLTLRAAHAAVFIATRKAEEVSSSRQAAQLEPPPLALVEKARAAVRPQLDHYGDGTPGGSPRAVDGGDLAALRKEYAEAVGKRPFPGWGEAVLREKIAAAREA